MRPFVCDLPAYRVTFGPGSIARLPDEVTRVGGTRAVVISMPAEARFAEEAHQRLGDLSAGVYTGVTSQHVPVEMLKVAAEHARSVGADCYVVIGGGSTVGVGKGIALETGLPIVAVPTTYAGSEMTPIYGVTEGGVKKTGRDRTVLPKAVIYDVNLTLSLPPHIAAPSGMNAMAHCVEALYADDGNPIVSLLAEEGIRALARSLPVVIKEPGNVEARSDAQYGAWLGGTVLGAVNMGIHHKLCHTLGGTFNLPHAETHTIVLPHATAYNRDAAPEAMKRIAAAIGAGDAADGIYDLIGKIGAPRALKDIGMPADGVDKAVDLALTARYPNPRPLEREALRQLLQRAYDGERP
ncbi:MAG: maleylacetate reductase [Vicinamibacterales bacterium]